MPTLLVIDRNDCFLPRGWVSAVLPEKTEPSAYERSGRLWKVVTVPDGPELSPRAALDPPRLSARSLIYDQGRIIETFSPKELIADRLASLDGTLTPIPGPESLDRSHSTIWDFGPGRTYSTPQAAFDALVAAVGSNKFTEKHYLRGWSGTYGQGVSGFVLYLTTVTPSSRYPLTIDVQPGESVIFDDQNGDAGLVPDEVNHLRVIDIRIIRAAFGISVYDQPVRDWLIERCELDGTGGGMLLGVSQIRIEGLRVIDCHFHHISGVPLGSASGLPNDYATRVLVSGCRIIGDEQAIWNNAPATYLLINNTFQAQGSGLKHEGTHPLILAGMINNVFLPSDAGFNCLDAADIGPGNVQLLHSDGNCFYPGTGWVANFNGVTMDLAGFREWFGQDEHSISAAPLLDENLSPLPGSPCLCAGVTWDYADRGGKARALSIDIGHEQLTDAKVPGVVARRAPEIARRK